MRRRQTARHRPSDPARGQPDERSPAPLWAEFYSARAGPPPDEVGRLDKAAQPAAAATRSRSSRACSTSHTTRAPAPRLSFQPRSRPPVRPPRRRRAAFTPPGSLFGRSRAPSGDHADVRRGRQGRRVLDGLTPIDDPHGLRPPPRRLPRLSSWPYPPRSVFRKVMTTASACCRGCGGAPIHRGAYQLSAIATITTTTIHLARVSPARRAVRKTFPSASGLCE